MQNLNKYMRAHKLPFCSEQGVMRTWESSSAGGFVQGIDDGQIC